MRKFFYWIYGVSIVFLFLRCAERSENVLEQILKSSDEKIQRVLKNRDRHEIQILYTQIERDSLNNPQFKEWSYGLDEAHYFYPASTAKLPIAILALEKLNALQQKGIPIDMHTPFHIHDPKTGQPIAQTDTTHVNGSLTIGHLIKKIFLVSDNDAYNYLFDFLGRDAINQRLQTIGLKNTQIHHKFLFGADNDQTWEYTFLSNDNTLYHQTSMKSVSTDNNRHLKGILKGSGYYSNRDLINKPMDFSIKNRISIKDLNGILQRILFPEVFEVHQRFTLSDADYEFLRFWMSRNTLESTAPNYRTNDYWDSYVKFFMYGDTKGEMTDAIRIYNKVGEAYGTLTDVAYIQNKEAGVEYMLTATVLVNDNGIFNDDIYEYESVGIPFLAALGRAVYDYEMQ